MCSSKNLNKEYWDGALNQYYTTLVQFTEYSFERMLKAKEIILDNNAPIEMKAKTCANIVHDVFEGMAREYFGNKEETMAGDFNGVFGILLKGKCFIRFNKLNENFSISNAQSDQRDFFVNQTKLDFFEDDIVYLNLGYRVDQFWTNIEGIHIVCWNGSFEWEIDIKYQVNDLEQTSIDFTDNPNEIQKPRTNVKRDNNSKENDKLEKHG